MVENKISNNIRVVDKVLPETAYLTPRQQEAFKKVEFKQGNLVSAPSTEAAFTKDDKTPWTWVINLAGETKYGQTDEVYNEKVHNLSVNCGKTAAKFKSGVFIEVSTAQVYDADKKASKEDAKLKPWTLLAKNKLKAEEDLKSIEGLNLIIVRPAIVYGVGDVTGITPRLVIAAVYKELKEEMKFLWTKELKINTVHVDDVCAALKHLATAFVKGDIKTSGATYNLADKSDSDQESINELLRKIFAIQTGYQGSILSNLAKLNLKDITEDINDKHLEPWSNICKRLGVASTPLTPYLDQELLYNNSLSVDGSLIETLGFKYSVPTVTEDGLRSVINSFIEIGIFPKEFL